MARHLSKLFDNMATLEFTKDDEGNEIKEANGMYSKENEYVQFNKCCDCSGQVRRYRVDHKMLLYAMYALH